MVANEDDRPVYPMPPSAVDEEGIPTCVACGCQDFEVTHVASWVKGVKKRRHKCKHCGVSHYSRQFWEADDTGIKSG